MLTFVQIYIYIYIYIYIFHQDPPDPEPAKQPKNEQKSVNPLPKFPTDLL